MANGTIKWFSDARGYGLVDVEAHTKDAFVHYTDLSSVGGTIEAGATVEFRLEKGEKLDRAREVVTSAGTPFGPTPQDAAPEPPSASPTPEAEASDPETPDDADRDDDAEAGP